MVASPGLSRHLAQASRGPSMVIRLCALSVLLFVVWAALAGVDQIVRAEGEVIASSRPQIIQNLEGGILAELHVREGDEVREGQVLARLYATRFQSSVDDLEDQITALEIRQLRLEAELAGENSFYVPETLALRSPEIVASEQALLRARQSDFASRSEGAARVLEQAAREKQLMEQLLAQKVVALIEATRARKAHADALRAYDEIVSQAELHRAEAYSDVLKEISTLRQNLKASEDQLDRTVLLAPMDGVVNTLLVTTIGGVVRPGEEILRIIPVDEELLVEARVNPRDIAGVRPGQAATIKLSAYDYTIWGTLKGKVEVLSADTFKDERRPDSEPHYRVLVRVDREALTARQAEIEIRPGMLATAELLTGRRRVLSALMKPLYKSGEALREPS